jgi:hypothetical protein
MALFVCRNVGVHFDVGETNGEIKPDLLDLVRTDGCNRRNWNTSLQVLPCGQLQERYYIQITYQCCLLDQRVFSPLTFWHRSFTFKF